MHDDGLQWIELHLEVQYHYRRTQQRNVREGAERALVGLYSTVLVHLLPVENFDIRKKIAVPSCPSS